MIGSRYPHRRLAVAVAALVLYTGGGFALPLVHAGTEVLQGTAGLEQGHSDTCPRIHSDAACVFVGTYQLPTQGTGLPARSLTDAYAPLVTTAEGPPRPTVLTALHVRAPPVT